MCTNCNPNRLIQNVIFSSIQPSLDFQVINNGPLNTKVVIVINSALLEIKAQNFGNQVFFELSLEILNTKSWFRGQEKLNRCKVIHLTVLLPTTYFKVAQTSINTQKKLNNLEELTPHPAFYHQTAFINYVKQQLLLDTIRSMLWRNESP